MANYLLVLSTPIRADQPWRDVMRRQLDGCRTRRTSSPATRRRRGRLTWVAREARSDVLPGGRGLFTGYAYDDEQRSHVVRQPVPGQGAGCPAEDLPGLPPRGHLGRVRGGGARRPLPQHADLRHDRPRADAPVGLRRVLLLRLRRRLGLPCTLDSTSWVAALAQCHVGPADEHADPRAGGHYVAVGQRVDVDLTDPRAEATVVTGRCVTVFAVGRRTLRRDDPSCGRPDRLRRSTRRLARPRGRPALAVRRQGLAHLPGCGPALPGRP